MAKNPKKILLYDTKSVEDLLPKLKPAFEEDIDENDDSEKSEISPTAEDLSNLSVGTNTSCSTCAIDFETLEDQRAHFKLDWHRFNIANKLKGTIDDFYLVQIHSFQPILRFRFKGSS